MLGSVHEWWKEGRLRRARSFSAIFAAWYRKIKWSIRKNRDRPASFVAHLRHAFDLGLQRTFFERWNRKVKWLKRDRLLGGARTTAAERAAAAAGRGAAAGRARGRRTGRRPDDLTTVEGCREKLAALVWQHGELNLACNPPTGPDLLNLQLLQAYIAQAKVTIVSERRRRSRRNAAQPQPVQPQPAQPQPPQIGLPPPLVPPPLVVGDLDVTHVPTTPPIRQPPPPRSRSDRPRRLNEGVVRRRCVHSRVGFESGDEGETDDQRARRLELLSEQCDIVLCKRRLERRRATCATLGIAFIPGPVGREETLDELKAREATVDRAIKDKERRTRVGCVAPAILEIAVVVEAQRTRASVRCACGAMRFPEEPLGVCCSESKVRLDPLPVMPRLLYDLWRGDDPVCKLARTHARALNNSLALASQKVSSPEPPPGRGGWQPTFCIQGRLYHKVGPLRGDNGAAKFAQLYIFDPGNEEVETSLRLHHSHLNRASARDVRLLRGIITQLQRELRNTNTYVRDFITASEIPADQVANFQIIINPDARPQGEHERRYNAPVDRGLQEISVLMSDEPSGGRTIAVRPRGGGPLHSIHETNRAFDPLHFVLLFPYGTDGWHLGIPHNEVVAGAIGGGGGQDDEDGAPDDYEEQEAARDRRSRDVTARQYYAFRLFPREGHPDDIFRAQRLFQEYCCMAFAKVEHMRLNYLRDHQADLRADLYQNFRDAVGTDDGTAANVGRLIVLPATFGGGPRDMQGKYLDAMAVVTRFGPRPDLFVTFTCNPTWVEITENLLPGQDASDRPDLLARVFFSKLKVFLAELTKSGAFGRCQAYCYTIEFQKRGLPHAHILIILDQRDKIRCADDVDAIISAELPPLNPDSPQATRLRNIVTMNMLHTKCEDAPGLPITDPEGKPTCMCQRPDKEGAYKCEKRFPKRFAPLTTWKEGDKYPSYRRREPTAYVGATFEKNGVVYDNRWVVPYSPYLCLRYDAHINVEAVISPFRIKYLFKYIHKGPDRTAAGMRDEDQNDEIKAYEDLRSCGSIEACWRVFGFPMSGRNPAIYPLTVHLPDTQQMYVPGHLQGEELRRRVAAGPPKTTLTAFFMYNRQHRNQLPQPLYVNFPETHVFVKSSREWKLRKKGFAIGRIHWVNPTDTERYFLRKLLLHDNSRGATSFFDVRTVAGHLYPTFKQAANALGLCADDTEWAETMAAAAIVRMPSQLRDLFCTLLLECEVTDPEVLFRTSALDMADDFMFEDGGAPEAKQGDISFVDDFPIVAARILLSIEERLKRHDKSLRDYSLPEPSDDERAEIARLDLAAALPNIPHLIREQTATTATEKDALRAECEGRRLSMTASQADFYDAVVALVDAENGGAIFVEAPGGTGKTFTFNAALDYVRADGGVALAVASSGIAAILLHLGRTMHSRFKAPVEGLAKNSTCTISKRTDLAELIRRTKLIVWDEAPMAHRWLLEALHRTLWDIMGSPMYELENGQEAEVPFGGIVIVLGGDWRQTLPVVKRGSRPQIVDAAIKKSQLLWPHFTTMHLVENMRVRRNGDNETLRAFAAWLLELGDGRIPTLPGYSDSIALPPEMCEPCNIDRAIDFAFPDLATHFDDAAWISGRAILAPNNVTVDALNAACLEKVPGGTTELSSADEAADGPEVAILPPELLNTLEGDGLPAHTLKLKVGATLILLRNINPTRGLCNGTRIVLRRCLGTRVLECEVAGGDFAGDIVLLPRITIYGSLTTWGFTWKRRQFPVRLAYALTINKSQGQSLDNVAVWLERPCFSHGQLYVGASRSGDPATLRFFVNPTVEGYPTSTRNVVFHEIFA